MMPVRAYGAHVERPVMVVIGTRKRRHKPTPDLTVPAHPAILRQRRQLNGLAYEAGR